MLCTRYNGYARTQREPIQCTTSHASSQSVLSLAAPFHAAQLNTDRHSCLQGGVVVEEFFSFLVLVNYVIPISLYVTVGEYERESPFVSV